MSLILDAFQFAARAHAGQTRKYNGAPYITHPIRVAGRVATMPIATEERVAVAILHDVSEDCGVAISRIRDLFGDKVADGVNWLTNPSKQFKHLPRCDRKALDRAHISEAPLEYAIIKAIDRIDNLGEMPASESFCELYAEESRDLGRAIEHKIPPGLFTELENAILRMEVARMHYRSFMLRDSYEIDAGARVLR